MKNLRSQNITVLGLQPDKLSVFTPRNLLKGIHSPANLHALLFLLEENLHI